MKTTVIVSCLSAALMTSMAIAGGVGNTTAATAKMPSANANLEAIAVLTAVNDHETKSAEIALSKTPSDAVGDYAKMLQAEHTSNQAKTRAIAEAADIPTVESPAVAALKQKSEAKREELSALDAEAFETAFIDAMVRDHAEVLALIDTELLPNATDTEVVAHLRVTRAHIARHLEQAKKLDDADRQASR